MCYTRQYKSNNSTFIRLSSNVQMHGIYFYISYIYFLCLFLILIMLIFILQCILNMQNIVIFIDIKKKCSLHSVTLIFAY